MDIYVWKVGRRDFGRFHILRIDLTVVHAPYFEANVSTLASKLIRRFTEEPKVTSSLFLHFVLKKNMFTKE